MNRLPRQQRRRKRRASRQRSDRPLRSALNARDLLQVKARIFGKRRQKGILAGGYRRSQLPAFEVLRGLDRSIVQYADAHRRVICASSERDGRQPLDGLQDRSRRRGHAEIEPGLADRLCGGDRARSAGDLDIEPMLLPEAHALGDKGEQIAALGNPRQGELDRFPVLGEDEARSGDGAGGDACRAQYPTAREPAFDAHGFSLRTRGMTVTKLAGTVPAAPWHISCSLWRETTARDKECREEGIRSALGRTTGHARPVFRLRGRRAVSG